MQSDGRSLNADALAWTALLAHWTEYAQAAKALPRGVEGERWRASVAHVISLQALTMALHDFERVPAQERPLARDRAAFQMRGALEALDEIWRAESMPEELLALAADAGAALCSAGLLADASSVKAD